jgi:hypothetical protein
MNDVEGAAKWPRKNELTVASDTAVGCDTMGAGTTPNGRLVRLHAVIDRMTQSTRVPNEPMSQ